MKVARARQVARGVTAELAKTLPGFRGAFLHGSINWMADDDVLPPTSDVDVGLVVEAPDPLPKLGKRPCEGVIVEPSCLPARRVESAEGLLADCKLGHSFRSDNVILDPTGRLREVQARVGRHFAERRWILARCEDASRSSAAYARAVADPAPYHQRLICWLFAQGNLAHVVLAAGMRNLTVRRRYAATRELLASAGREELQETLLAKLGCAGLPRERVEHHLDRMSEVFDVAAFRIRSEFPFGSDLCATARPIAVDGSREMIERGEHREAMFWIAVTYARCMTVLHSDAPGSLADAHDAGLRDIARDLGVGSSADLARSAREVEAWLPRLSALAEELVAANPEARD